MRPMDVKQIFIDTNVLVYSTDTLSPWKVLAKKAIQKAREQSIELLVSQQVLREYIAVTTRFSVSGSGIPLREIVENVQTFQTEFTILSENPRILKQLIDLVQEIPMAGKQVHDANIVATMLVYGIDYLLTYNIDDFKRFSGKIHILSLEDWVKQRS